MAAISASSSSALRAGTEDNLAVGRTLAVGLAVDTYMKVGIGPALEGQVLVTRKESLVGQNASSVRERGARVPENLVAARASAVGRRRTEEAAGSVQEAVRPDGSSAA